MSVKPAFKVTAEKNLSPTYQNHDETHEREQVEEIEMAGQPVNAEGRQVEEEHRDNVSHAKGAMQASPFWIQKDKTAQHQTNNSAKYVYSADDHENHLSRDTY
jgi:hypothetical protein